MHKVKALVLTVSLLGLAATASFAHGMPNQRGQAPCPPAVRQHQRAERWQRDGHRSTVTIIHVGQRGQQARAKKHTDRDGAYRYQRQANRGHRQEAGHPQQRHHQRHCH